MSIAFASQLLAPAGKSSEAVSRQLRTLIFSGEIGEGSRLPSERELAARMGLARGTVRSALADLERDGLVEGGVRQVRRVRRGLNNGLTLAKTIGVAVDLPLVGEAPLLQRGWPSFIQVAAMASIQQRGLQTMSLVLSDPVSEPLSQWRQVRPSGIVVAYDLASTPSAPALCNFIEESRIPAVIHCDDVGHLASFDRVCTDHYAGGRLLAEALLSRGCRRILRVYRSPDRTSYWDRRDEAFEAVHREAGINALPPLRTTRFADRGNSPDAADFDHFSRLLMSYLYAQFQQFPDIDAIIASSDRSAYYVSAACRMLGKEPGRDVMIAGYDNSWAEAPERKIGHPAPSLTIDKHHDQIGMSLIGLLVDRLEGRLPPGPQKRLVEPTLVEI